MLRELLFFVYRLLWIWILYAPCPYYKVLSIKQRLSLDGRHITHNSTSLTHTPHTHLTIHTHTLPRFSTFSFNDRPKYGTAPENMMHSVLIHDYYSRLATGPNVIFLTLDTTLRAGTVSYVCVCVCVGGGA